MSKDNSNESMVDALKEKGLQGKILCVEGELDELSLSKTILKAEYDVLGVSSYKSEFLPLSYHTSIEELINKNTVAAFTSSAAVYGFIKGGNISDVSKVKAVCIGKQTYKTAVECGIFTSFYGRKTYNRFINRKNRRNHEII